MSSTVALVPETSSMSPMETGKKRPRTLNLYLTEEVQNLAKALAEARSSSLSGLVAQLIRKEGALVMPDREAKIVAGNRAQLARLLGASKIEYVDHAGKVTAMGKKGSFLYHIFHTEVIPQQTFYNLLQDYAVRAVTEDLAAVIWIVSDEIGDDAFGKYEQLAQASGLVPIFLARARDMAAAIKSAGMALATKSAGEIGSSSKIGDMPLKTSRHVPRDVRANDEGVSAPQGGEQT